MTSVLPSTASYLSIMQGESLSPNDNNAAPVTQNRPIANTSPTGDVIDLSTRAQTLLQYANASKDTAADISVPFKERMAKRMNDFAANLSVYFKKNFIAENEEFSFNIDRYGVLHVNGPHKKKVEEYFQNNPEAVKELKTLSALSTLEATHEALRLYNAEKKQAVSKEQQDAVADRYAVRMMHIQTLTGLMFFKDGKLTSAALEYAASLSTDPD
jgi:hypothetical protein